MLENIPLYIPLIFGLTTALALLLFFWILKNSHSPNTRQLSAKITVGLAAWLIIQGIVTYLHVYSSTTHIFPPTILLFGILPAILTIVITLATKKGRLFMDSLPLSQLTYLHTIRIPVEFVLYWLFLSQAVPELMTFAGRNFDIIAGITAPLIAYFGIKKHKISKTVVLIWHFICLGLLLHIVVNAFLSAPSPVQKFAFDQPNIAILYFPFSWLPTFIVPVVLFCHLAAIRQLLHRSN